MGAIHIDLPPDLQELVDREIASGAFATASDYLQSLLRQENERRDALIAALDEGEASGFDPRDMDTIFADLRGRATA